MFSTTTVLPSKFKIIPSYFLSKSIKSDATPTIPDIPVSLYLPSLVPFTDVIGKNDALPNLLSFKNFTNFLASSSVSVTMF